MTRHIRHTLRALALGACLLVSGAGTPAVAAEAAGVCTDNAWAEYNTCLMESGGFEWARRECDIEFQADYVACFGAIITGIFGIVAKVM